jgi:circadian clock protein KaiC
VRVRKLRGVSYRGGFHDYRIKTGGIVVFPRLVAAEHTEQRIDEEIQTGLPSLDALLGGGITRGSSTLIMGPAGAGKSTFSSQFLHKILSSGEAASVNLFDESRETFLFRARQLGLALDAFVESGLLILRSVDPAESTPGELAQLIREDVEKRNARFVSIDSLNGYIYAMPDEQFLTLHVHELVTYLSHKGVTVFLILAQHGLVGAMANAPGADLSYTADSVILFRYFESRGEIRRAVSMLKKRHGRHEETIREYSLRNGRLEVGEPLTGFHGVLTGVPSFEGNAQKLSGRDPK